MGGTIAYYARQGVEITLVCATKGEAGTVDAEYLEGFASVADLRESELRCAVETLGIQKLILLGYRDSGMQGSVDNEHKQAFINTDEDEVVARLVEIMREVQPDIVLTFDETGGYYHPDHIFIHHTTLRAYQDAGDSKKFSKLGKPFTPQALYFNARSRKSVRRVVRLLRIMGKDPAHMGRNSDIDLTRLIEDGDTTPHVTVNYQSVYQLKEKADRCHASQFGQNGLSLSSMLRFFRRFGGGQDEFTRHLPPTADDFRATDLFSL